jgi:hypothetical protein
MNETTPVFIQRLKLEMELEVHIMHNIIQIHNNVLWD